MKKLIGVVKKIDKLGRVVIPKEMRELYKLQSKVEIIVTENGLLMRNPEYLLVKKAEKN